MFSPREKNIHSHRQFFEFHGWNGSFLIFSIEIEFQSQVNIFPPKNDSSLIEVAVYSSGCLPDFETLSLTAVTRQYPMD